MSAADRLVVALDHDDPGEASALVDALADQVRRYKVGSVLFTRAGPPFVRDLVGRGKDVFLDLKFHDTPATVAGAVAAAAALGVDLLTVHAVGGRAMIDAARAAVRGADRRPRLLAVTVLTSLDAGAWSEIAGPAGRPLAAAVTVLARAALETGADGLVCSAAETAALREAIGPAPLLVVPGIRPAWSASDHAGQARTATPAAALEAGASAIVVGRAITAAADPATAAARVVEEIAAA